MTSFGFDFHERDTPPSSEDLAAAWRQYVEPCIEAFGVDRCMFESNFPPDKQSHRQRHLNCGMPFKRHRRCLGEETALSNGMGKPPRDRISDRARENPLIPLEISIDSRFVRHRPR